MKISEQKRPAGRPKNDPRFAAGPSHWDDEEDKDGPTIDRPAATTSKPWEKYAKPPVDWDGEIVVQSDSFLNIDPEVRQMYWDEYGIDLQWVAESCTGMPLEENVLLRKRNHWEEVEPGSIPEIPTVRKGGLVLMARPRCVSEKARAQQQKDAREPLETAKLRAGEGDLPGVTLNPRHSSARQFNHMRSTVERLNVPQDD
jgi:hypothetical protein